MKTFNENELRELLLCYKVSGPTPQLVDRTRQQMREIMLQPVLAPVRTEKWVFLLVGLTVVMSLCLFYMFTVGTILRFVLPENLIDILRHSLYAFTAAGGSVLVCALMVLCFKQLYVLQPERRLTDF